MADDQEAKATFVRRVSEKRQRIASYVSELEPRAVRLTVVSLICSGLVTILTGGRALTDVLGAGTGGWPNWTVLGFVVGGISLVGTVATEMHRRQDVTSRLARAQATAARLEGLTMLVELGHLPIVEAVKRYEECIQDVSFIPAQDATAKGSRALDRVEGGFKEPRDGEIVGNEILCAGWVKGLGPGVSIWIAVEIGGKLWPKETPLHIEADGLFRSKVFEEGAADQWGLSLFAAESKADRQIGEWLAKCDQTGDYSELSRPPGLKRLDRVTVSRRAE